MKFRNILLTTFAASAFVIGTTSCSDSFLDEKMYSSYGPEVSDVNAKLVGLHRQYAAIWGMSSQQGFVGCWQVGTDVGAPGDTQGGRGSFLQISGIECRECRGKFPLGKII